MGIKLSILAERLNGELSGNGEIEISRVVGIQDAGPGSITFITGTQYLKALEQSHASAAIVPLDMPPTSLPVLRVDNPKLAFARALELFYVHPAAPRGISDKAAVGADVIIGPDCSVYPFAVLADRVKLGARVTIHSGCSIGEDSTIEDDTVIHANVSIGHGVSVGKRVIIHSGTVIGSDGFGFVTEGGCHHKIPQVGGVVVEDDVEIGANCTIDRATLGNTLIKKGTKIDNLVQIAHNVTIGEHCLVAGQAGIAGSSTLGNYVVLAGQAGVADHVHVGDKVMAGGGSAVTRDVDSGQMIAGYNAMPLRDWLKVQAVLPRLPELRKLITNLQKQVQELEKQR